MTCDFVIKGQSSVAPWLALDHVSAIAGLESDVVDLGYAATEFTASAYVEGGTTEQPISGYATVLLSLDGLIWYSANCTVSLDTTSVGGGHATNHIGYGSDVTGGLPPIRYKPHARYVKARISDNFAGGVNPVVTVAVAAGAVS